MVEASEGMGEGLRTLEDGVGEGGFGSTDFSFDRLNDRLLVDAGLADRRGVLMGVPACFCGVQDCTTIRDRSETGLERSGPLLSS